MLPTKFRIIWPSGFREDIQKSTNQKKELPVVAMFVNGSGRNDHSLQRTRSDGKNSHCLWQDEVKKIEIHVYIYYKCSFISIVMHISVIQFRYIYRYNCTLNTYIYIYTRVLFLLTVQIFKNRPIRNKNCRTARFANEQGRNQQSLQRIFHRCFLPSFS